MNATAELKNENEFLRAQLVQRDELIADRDAKISSLVHHYDTEIEALKEKLKLALMRRFGKSSEKLPFPSPQLELFNESEEEL